MSEELQDFEGRIDQVTRPIKAGTDSSDTARPLMTILDIAALSSDRPYRRSRRYIPSPQGPRPGCLARPRRPTTFNWRQINAGRDHQAGQSIPEAPVDPWRRNPRDPSRGRCGIRTHDYKHHGTTSLFAALDVLERTVVGNCYERHRHQEVLKFRRRLDREFSQNKPLHLILDNYGTHTHPNVKAWLAKHPRLHLHFTPTSCSWLNLIERWFDRLTEKQLRRGAFTSVKDLTSTIKQFTKVYNNDPKPFVWNAKVDDILRKVGKYKTILETVY